MTTKANGNDIDVFGVGSSGRLSASPVVNAEGSTVPFAITFDRAGHLVIADAGTNALSAFALNSDGTVTLIDSVGTAQAGTCWVAPAGGTLFASNAGSANVSGYASSASGQLTLLGQTTSEEVCSVLDISESNQRVLLHRARSRLRQAVETEFGGPS